MASSGILLHKLASNCQGETRLGGAGLPQVRDYTGYIGIRCSSPLASCSHRLFLQLDSNARVQKSAGEAAPTIGKFDRNPQAQNSI